MIEIHRVIVSMNRRIALLSLLAAVALLPANRSFGARPIYDYEPATVTLRGTVVLESERGPPGFGENAGDPVEEVVMLHTQPFDVRGKSEDALDETESAVDVVQLFRDKFTGALRGCMEVSGTLFHAHTGHHHTKVLLDVREARAVDGCAPGGRSREKQPHSFARPSAAASVGDR